MRQDVGEIGHGTHAVLAQFDCDHSAIKFSMSCFVAADICKDRFEDLVAFWGGASLLSGVAQRGSLFRKATVHGLSAASIKGQPPILGEQAIFEPRDVRL